MIQAFREEAPSPELIAKARECILDPEHERWSWTLEPDLKKSDYTIGFAKFTPLPTDDPNITNALSALVSSMGIRMKVEPQIVNAGEKNITRTIIVTDPNGNETRTDTRVQILSLLIDRELCVNDIAQAIELSQSAVSHQLRLLKQMHLIKFRRDGKNILYSLADDHVLVILQTGREHVLE